MEAAQGTLREIREALKQPAADAGPTANMLLTRRINFVAIRTTAQWLMGAAEDDLHQRRLEEGLQDLEALVALARMERDEYTLVAQMIRVAVAGLGLTTTGMRWRRRVGPSRNWNGCKRLGSQWTWWRPWRRALKANGRAVTSGSPRRGDRVGHRPAGCSGLVEHGRTASESNP